MREIKFRGYDKRSKSFVIGDLMTDYVHHEPYWTIIIGGCIYHKVKPKTVGQYTGLKDKNGKEIYEGDILKNHGGLIAQVIYQAPEFVMKKKPSHKTWFSFILAASENQYEGIIGNIYENPELLT